LLMPYINEAVVALQEVTSLAYVYEKHW
jgi:hypothetical protein